ncbi:hypothetical protein E2986_14024, partial [Frieseomelitta varia]
EFLFNERIYDLLSQVVTILLERGAAVDHQDKDGMTPLLVAAFEGHRDVCELLLEYEADVDHCDATGRTPLWAAASMGHGSVVALLLFWGCYVDSIDNEGRTVLSVAAAQGGTDVVKQLLDRGLDEQHRDNSGWTPLHYAAFEGHIDVCEALLEAGAKIDETDNDGKGALMLAAQEGHAALVERLLEQHRAPIDQHAHDGKTALRLAALEGHYDTVRVLLTHNADVNAKDADGRSTLYILALENRLAMARFLLEHARADVESRDSEGRTPLHVSAWQGHVEMVALLLTEGSASVNACDNENRTPLHSAAWQGHAAIVRLLLEHGATPDHTCNQGATALAYSVFIHQYSSGIAAQEGHEHCVRALLNHGADPSHSDHCGRNAIKVAAKSGHDTVVRLLEEHSANQRSLRPGINGGKIGKMALYYYTTTTLLGIVLSVTLVQTIRPGDLLKNRNILTQNATRYSMTVDTILDLFRNLMPDNIVSATLFQYQTVLEKPKNESVPIDEWKISHTNTAGTNVLGLVFFSLILGLAIENIGAKGEPLIEFFRSLSDAMMKIMSWIITLVPVSALFLICAKILDVEDFDSVIKRLGIYILTVFSGLLIQGFILLPLVYFICTRQSPYNIIAKLGPAFVTAFGTSSSLPSGGYVMLIMVLNSVGVPVEDVSLIIAIDWFVDRFRTTLNIIADALGAGIISHYYKKDKQTSVPEEMELYTSA